MTSKTDDPEYDIFSDPSNPRKIHYEDILAASKRIAGQVLMTPCPKAEHLSELLGVEIYMKQEFLQHTGSFKERGVRNTLILLSEEQKKLGVITASTGNHGCALSYHATSMGIPSIVVMPVHAPIIKITRCEKLGAKMVKHGNDMAGAKRQAMIIAKEKKMQYINGYDHPNVIEGQGTTAIEIIEQVPNVDAILVPCGGGSLLTGCCVAIKHLKPDTEVYGIETDKTSSMLQSLKKNERVTIQIPATIADGLAVNTVGVNSFHNLKGLVTKVVSMHEDWVARAIMHIVETEKFIVEGAGATPIAAIMAGLLPNLKGKRVVFICTGGNIDTTTLSRSLERGMAAEGRLLKFKVIVPDRPDGIAELCHLLASHGVTIKDFIPERAWVKGDVFSVEIKIVVETKGWENTREMVESVKKNYKRCTFPDMNETSSKSGGMRRGPCLAPTPICMQK